MAAEMHGLVYIVNMGITIKETLIQLLKKEANMKDYVESRMFWRRYGKQHYNRAAASNCCKQLK